MNKKSILIVEDEGIIQRLFLRLLGPLGHGLVCAGGLAEGIQKMKVQRLDLLITDLKLPDGAGIDVIRHFKEKFPRSDVLIVTASLTPEEQLRRASAMGVTKYLYKPFEAKELLSAVRSALKN
ncbi:MAG: response regulator [Elusimicrobia bacterium]|nr:response regulator [Candidatus Obscuribacterium magneticum]